MAKQTQAETGFILLLDQERQELFCQVSGLEIMVNGWTTAKKKENKYVAREGGFADGVAYVDAV